MRRFTFERSSRIYVTCTRSLTETERERIIPILETRPSIDVEVHFDFDSSVITEQAKPQLNEIADALRNAALKGTLVLLSGHADAYGGQEYTRSR